MSVLLQAAKSYGLGWLAARLTYEMQVRSGFQTFRFAQRPWDENELARWLSPGIASDPTGYARHWRANRPHFFFDPADCEQYQPRLREIAGDQGVERLAEEVEEMRCGRFRYFFAQQGELGFPPDWHHNPFTGQCSEPRAHWSRIPMFSHSSGDLKFIWEPGRFASAFTLARAGWMLGDENCSEMFWQLIESWAAANPPNHGAHWKCGQETSLRLMAWCFALYAFAESPATTPQRIALIVGMIAAQADRVAKDHVYAHLQRNNHAISEGVGLWTVGLLFPELKNAASWREQGREILVREATAQIALDGSYVQNSTNYHRLMLHDYLWSLRLGETCGEPLPASVRERIERAVEFLFQLSDEATGRVPCYGNNDGALILPLNTCDYTDFRPVLSAGHFSARGEKLFAPGAWDEDLLWLFGPSALAAKPATAKRASFAAKDGGYYVLRGAQSFALTRCTSYRYRPAQADMLGFDLWWRGQNVCGDAGTFLYYADAPWDNSLVRTSVHNTVTVDGQNQMASGPRFMWFDWTKAEALAFARSTKGQLECFQGQHSGYARLASPAIHRRAILRLGDDLWIVVDDLLGEGAHDIQCQWLFAPGAYELDARGLRLALDSEALHVRWHAPDLTPNISTGDETKAPRGWRSPYYGVKEPALSLELAGRTELPRRIVTMFAFGDAAPAVRFGENEISVGDDLVATLAPLELSARRTIANATCAETLSF